MTETDPLTFRVMNEIGIIHQLATTASTAALPGGLTMAQFGILNHFVRLEPGFESPARLASAFQVSRPTMTNTLMRLERSGLVVITPDAVDRRGKRVAITDKGRSIRNDAIERLAAPIERTETALGRDLLEEILPLLTEMREKLDAMRD